jgi:hypothetical protein
MDTPRASSSQPTGCAGRRLANTAPTVAALAHASVRSGSNVISSGRPAWTSRRCNQKAAARSSRANAHSAHAAPGRQRSQTPRAAEVTAMILAEPSSPAPHLPSVADRAVWPSSVLATLRNRGTAPRPALYLAAQDRRRGVASAVLLHGRRASDNAHGATVSVLPPAFRSGPAAVPEGQLCWRRAVGFSIGLRRPDQATSPDIVGRHEMSPGSGVRMPARTRPPSADRVVVRPPSWRCRSLNEPTEAEQRGHG